MVAEIIEADSSFDGSIPKSIVCHNNNDNWSTASSMADSAASSVVASVDGSFHGHGHVVLDERSKKRNRSYAIVSNNKRQPITLHRKERGLSLSSYWSKQSADDQKTYLKLRLPLECPPQLNDMGYPQDLDGVESGKQDVPLPNLKRRQVSFHARMESWQHQLQKPLRVFSGIVKLSPKRKIPCLDSIHILDSVMNQQPAALTCSSESTGSDGGPPEWTDADFDASTWNVSVRSFEQFHPDACFFADDGDGIEQTPAASWDERTSPTKKSGKDKSFIRFSIRECEQFNPDEYFGGTDIGTPDQTLLHDNDDHDHDDHPSFKERTTTSAPTTPTAPDPTDPIDEDIYDPNKDPDVRWLYCRAMLPVMDPHAFGAFTESTTSSSPPPAAATTTTTKTPKTSRSSYATEGTINKVSDDKDDDDLDAALDDFVANTRVWSEPSVSFDSQDRSDQLLIHRLRQAPQLLGGDHSDDESLNLISEGDLD